MEYLKEAQLLSLLKEWLEEKEKPMTTESTPSNWRIAENRYLMYKHCTIAVLEPDEMFLGRLNKECRIVFYDEEKEKYVEK